MLKIIAKFSLIGPKEENQDSFFIKEYDNSDMLLAVADGMGGGVLGKELSHKAVEILEQNFMQPPKYPLPKLKQSVGEINEILHAMLNGQKGGTTLAIVYYREPHIYYINIGDSRIWLQRGGKIYNITRDQNRYTLKLLQGEMPSKKEKKIVEYILGISTNTQIDKLLESSVWSAFGSFVLEAGDTLFLSTDGFHDNLQAEDLKILSSTKGINSKLLSVIANVNKRSDDNLTFIIARREDD